MPLPRFIEIDGKRYRWRDLVALRLAQATPPATQPALFELREDSRDCVLPYCRALGGALWGDVPSAGHLHSEKLYSR